MLGIRLQNMGQVLSKKVDQNIPQVLRTSVFKKVPWKVFSHPLVSASLLIFLLFFYVGIPIWFYFCPWIRRHAVFLNKMDWPFQDFHHPESYGLTCVRNFYVETSPGVLLGVWHMMPQSLHSLCASNRSWSMVPYSFDKDDRPVVLYLHGSAESRTAAYRRSMYKVLSSVPLDFHVISFDYRGFGDSAYIAPTTTSITEDAEAMFKWLKARVPLSRMYFWGHSLGSSVAVHLGERTSLGGENPSAIVLEAPFTSVADATVTFPLSFFHRRLPFFREFCTEMTRTEDTNFDSDSKIGNVTAPLLILHAADDTMVWSEQGKQLWRKALKHTSRANRRRPMFVELDGQYGCGHRNIHKAPNLPQAVLNFVEGTAH